MIGQDKISITKKSLTGICHNARSFAWIPKKTNCPGGTRGVSPDRNKTISFVSSTCRQAELRRDSVSKISNGSLHFDCSCLPGTIKVNHLIAIGHTPPECLEGGPAI